MTAARPRPIEPPLISAASPRRRARTSAPSSRSLRAAGAAVAFAAMLLLLAYIAEYATVAKASYDRYIVRAELYHLSQENSNLHAQVESLERPSRVDHMARLMGMQQRDQADFVSLAPAAQPKPKDIHPMVAGFLPENWRLWGSR